MLEGLMQAYLELFSKAWVPRDERPFGFKDSPVEQRVLVSPPSEKRGSADVQTHNDQRGLLRRARGLHRA